jgi:predicted transcriptional regulator
MALIAQWTRQRPWISAGLAGAAGGFVGFAGGLVSTIGMLGLSKAGVKSRVIASEHPFRFRILRTLEANPGLCYRELQATMGAANGTLRHHLDVLQGHRSISIAEVNGRTCYFAGGQAQIVDMRGQFVDLEEAARRMPIGLSLVQRMIIDDLQDNGIPRSQASLARRIGRSRATVHSALKVLRRRGIIRDDCLEISPYLIDTNTMNSTHPIDYEWNDGRD